MANEIENKIVLITGGTGTIGMGLTEEILKRRPRQLRILSRDDTKQYYMQEKMGYPKELRLFIGDVRDKERLDLAFDGVDIVFHAAALKHVPLCEYNPFEAVKTNIIGSQNVIEAALKNRVSKVIAISTDKAVNPVNVMGVSKLMMEKLFIGANYYKGTSQTKFSCVRFGNVAWARGSVLPLWQKTAEKEKSIKITDPEMTRFFMSQSQAINLTLKAMELTLGGEIFVLKMPSIKLADLASLFLEKYFKDQNINIETKGARPGEKLHEELINPQENYKWVFESQDMFILVPELFIFGLEMQPSEYPGFSSPKKIEACSSELFINQEKIKELI